MCHSELKFRGSTRSIQNNLRKNEFEASFLCYFLIKQIFCYLLQSNIKYIYSKEPFDMSTEQRRFFDK